MFGANKNVPSETLDKVSDTLDTIKDGNKARLASTQLDYLRAHADYI